MKSNREKLIVEASMQIKPEFLKPIDRFSSISMNNSIRESRSPGVQRGVTDINSRVDELTSFSLDRRRNCTDYVLSFRHNGLFVDKYDERRKNWRRCRT